MAHIRGKAIPRDRNIAEPVAFAYDRFISLRSRTFMEISTEEEVAAPTLDTEAFERVRAALAKSGSLAAVDSLIVELRAVEDFSNLF